MLFMKKCDQILLYMKKCHEVFNFACEKHVKLNFHWLLHYFLEMYGSFFTESSWYHCFDGFYQISVKVCSSYFFPFTYRSCNLQKCTGEGGGCEGWTKIYQMGSATTWGPPHSTVLTKYIKLSIPFQLWLQISVVSSQAFGGTGQIEIRLEKPRRVETRFETMQNLIHSSKK